MIITGILLWKFKENYWSFDSSFEFLLNANNITDINPYRDNSTHGPDYMKPQKVKICSLVIF